MSGDRYDAIKPHIYMPDYQAMGDCRACGHEANKPWHIYSYEINKSSEGIKMSSKSLTFTDLRFANVQRNAEWDPEGKITGAFRGLEFAGEAGEFIEAVQEQLINLAITAGLISNMVKKAEREKLGLKGSRVSLIEMAKEFGDAQITLDLLAMHFSIDLEESVKMVFNAKSDEHGFATKLREHEAPDSLEDNDGDIDF